MPDPAILTRPDGTAIAYHHLAGKSPGIVFCGGFMSDMEGSKALALEEYCRASGRAFTRFDYRGHGLSSGKFAEGTIGKINVHLLAISSRSLVAFILLDKSRSKCLCSLFIFSTRSACRLYKRTSVL